MFLFVYNLAEGTMEKSKTTQKIAVIFKTKNDFQENDFEYNKIAENLYTARITKDEIEKLKINSCVVSVQTSEILKLF